MNKGKKKEAESGDNISPVIATADFGGSDIEISDRIASIKGNKLGEPLDVDLNPKYWRVSLSVIVYAADEQTARDEVRVLTSDDIERIISVSEV